MTRSTLPFHLRQYEAGDAEAIAHLYYQSARTLGARRYSPEQVAAWAPEPVAAAVVHNRACDGRFMLVAVDPGGRLLAYGDLEPNGHIDHLYASPEAAGNGVAGAILDALIHQATTQGLLRLHVEASELARGLFERKSFTVEHRRDFEVHGVAIHNYAMGLKL